MNPKESWSLLNEIENQLASRGLVVGGWARASVATAGIVSAGVNLFLRSPETALNIGGIVSAIIAVQRLESINLAQFAVDVSEKIHNPKRKEEFLFSTTGLLNLPRLPTPRVIKKPWISRMLINCLSSVILSDSDVTSEESKDPVGEKFQALKIRNNNH